MRMYWKKYIAPYKWKAILGFFFKMTEAFTELCIPMVVADVVDHGVAVHNVHYIWVCAGRLFALALIGYCSALICQWFASVTSQGFGTLIRRDLFKAINRFDYDHIDEIGTPTLITRITSDVYQLQDLVAMTIRLVSRSPFLIIGSIVAAFLINVQIALIFLIAAPLIALAIYLVMSKTQPLYMKVQQMLDRVGLITRENLSGVRVIRAFNKQENEIDRFEKTTAKQRNLQIHAGNIAALMTPATTVIVNVGIIFILYVSGLKINAGDLTQGDVLALINYMNEILLSMYVFSNVILLYIKGGASYRRIGEVLAVKPNVTPGEKDVPETYDSIIRFDDVSLSYAQGHALSHVSFDIKPGETVGVIGGTGAGKSSLVNLIPRFYDATEGHVYVKDQDVRDYQFDALRGQIGIVPQTAVLFSGTIKDNLLWGNKNATDEDIEEALRVSQAKEIVDKMKDGVNTVMEANGKNVSGGQRQRLTIARALVRHPDILILDDSASALDFATDAKLRRALKGLKTTTIIVSQRVSAMRSADKIIVLDHGHIAGKGTHEQLYKNCLIYKEIVDSQEEGNEHEA